MTSDETTSCLVALQATWKYQAMPADERLRWERLLTFGHRADFEKALDRAMAEGSKRRPMVGEFGELMRVFAIERRAIERQHVLASAMSHEVPTPTKVKQHLDEIRQSVPMLRGQS